MGGFGSGYRWTKKSVVESCDAIDTGDLWRWGMLAAGATRSGALEWRRSGDEKPSSSLGYTLTITTENGSLRLRYRFGTPPEATDYPVRLVATNCHLGGARWWFVCPLTKDSVRCGRRVRKLYRCGRYFGCRHCHGLTYRSNQESDSRVYAAVRGGLDLGEIYQPGRMSVCQLGFALKVLTFEQKRLDRLDKGLSRTRHPKGPRRGEQTG